jgi:hypothetical protein
LYRYLLFRRINTRKNLLEEELVPRPVMSEEFKDNFNYLEKTCVLFPTQLLKENQESFAAAYKTLLKNEGKIWKASLESLH